jgi:hypothetical protein
MRRESPGIRKEFIESLRIVRRNAGKGTMKLIAVSFLGMLILVAAECLIPLLPLFTNTVYRE